MVTGAVTRQCAPRLKTIYEQIPAPKSVMAIGACACSGGIFHNCYGILRPLDEVIPVDVYVAGCPPKPEAMLEAITKMLGNMGSKQ